MHHSSALRAELLNRCPPAAEAAGYERAPCGRKAKRFICKKHGILEKPVTAGEFGSAVQAPPAVPGKGLSDLQMFLDLAEGFAFDLTDALAGQLDLGADILEGHGLIAVEAVAHAQDHGLAFIQ